MVRRHHPNSDTPERTGPGEAVDFPTPTEELEPNPVIGSLDTDVKLVTSKVTAVEVDSEEEEQVLISTSAGRPANPAVELSDPETDSLEDLFTQEDAGSMGADQLLHSSEVTQIAINAYNKIIFTNHTGTHVAANSFPSSQDYVRWIESTLRLTNLFSKDVLKSESVSSGIFTGGVRGSIHISPTSLTGSDPAVLIKRWPTSTATLDQLESGKVLSSEIRVLLESCVRGRTGVIVSGPSGVGKSSMVRALSLMIEPASRVVSVERLPELDLGSNLPNTVSLSDPKAKELGTLLASAISMRPDRLVVGEVDREGWLPLTRFSTSGGTGFIAATPSISAQLAIDGALDALKSHGYSPEHAAELLTASVGVVVHLGRGTRGRRVVFSVSELTRSGGYIGLRTLNKFDIESDTFVKLDTPSQGLVDGWAGWGILPTIPLPAARTTGKSRP